MLFSNVYIESFGYELAPNVVTSEDIEERLAPLYEVIHIQKGQLEFITGIRERRFWDPGFKVSQGAIMAGEKAIEDSGVDREQIGMLVYGGVCRDNLEPATACAVADGLKLGARTHIYDVSNACLGILNGMIHVASAIELGQIQAGLVLSCESARQIVEMTIENLRNSGNMELFKKSIATLTGGSGAVAVLLTDKSLTRKNHQLLGGTLRNASEHHGLCRWGPDMGIPSNEPQVMETDSVGVLKNGVTLGIETFKDFKRTLKLKEGKPDKVVCHQVGAAHQRTILNSLGIGEEKDFSTYRFLGNIGTVSLPITAAIASERDFFDKNDLVGFLGIGSGLNCLMLAFRW